MPLTAPYQFREMLKNPAPLTCPSEDCYDRIPKNLDDAEKVRICETFKEFQAIFDSHDPYDEHISDKEVEICVYIKKLIKKAEANELAEHEGWPIAIDFKRLPDRIMTMKDDLKKLLNEGMKSENIVLEALKNDLWSLGYLARTLMKKFAGVQHAPSYIIENSRPG